MALTTYDDVSSGSAYDIAQLLKRMGLSAPVAPWQTIDYDAYYKANQPATATTAPSPVSATVVPASALMSAPAPSGMETMPTYTRTSAPVKQPVASMFDGLGLPTTVNPIPLPSYPSAPPSSITPSLGTDSILDQPRTQKPVAPPVTYGDKKDSTYPMEPAPLPTYTAPLPEAKPSEPSPVETMPTYTKTAPVATSAPPAQAAPAAEAKPPAQAPLPEPAPLAPWQKIDYDAYYKTHSGLPTSNPPATVVGGSEAKANADALFKEVMPDAAKAKEQIQAGDVAGGTQALSDAYKIPLPQAQENATTFGKVQTPVTVEAPASTPSRVETPATVITKQPETKAEAPVKLVTTIDTGVQSSATGQANTPAPLPTGGPGDKGNSTPTTEPFIGPPNPPGTVTGPPLPPIPTPSTPGNQGTAQAGITTPPPIAPLTPGSFTPPTPSTPRDRLDLPTPPSFIPTPFADTLAKNPAVTVKDRRDLPDLPTFKPGNFQEYLAANSTGGQTPEQLAAEAKRLRELQTNPLLSQITSDRAAAQKRAELALSQVGQGKEAALYGLDQGFKDKLAQIQALAIRNGLTASNIPLEQDIRPLTNDYNIQRRGIEESIANKITQLQLEAQLGDQDAARKLQDIQSSAGTLEASKLFDLTQAERSFGEQSRQNRLGEFGVTQNLSREASQTDFANRLGLVNTTEQQRQADIGQNQQNRQQSLNEYLGVNNLTREASQGDFANRLGLVNAAEQQRQADIAQGQQGRQQSFAEFLGQQNLGLEGKKLEDALANSGMSRQMTAAEINDLSNPNSLKNRLGNAQIGNLNAEAANNMARATNGGIDFTESRKFSVDMVAKVMAAGDVLNSPTATPQQKAGAQAALNAYKAQYNSIKGNDFDAAFGGITSGASTTPGAGESPAVFQANKAKAIQDAATMQGEITGLENAYTENAKNPAWLATWGESRAALIKQKRDALDALKKQYGL